MSDRFIRSREKLQGILNGFEGAGIPDAHGLLLFLGGDDGIPGPGGLVGVVDPGVNAAAVLDLCDGIGNIAPVVLAPVGQGEFCKHIRGGLLSPEDRVLGIGFVSDGMEGRSIAFTIMGIEHLAGGGAAGGPSLRHAVSRP